MDGDSSSHLPPLPHSSLPPLLRYPSVMLCTNQNYKKITLKFL
ncbi:hypothetical protein E2C01_054368 [Portunus trituberculatus]|uniref:Uncharacterized protein n=1 Tax=Portunus trituberculatus TaxID=210409 RepID=A0A5B7GT06_PORTR|nr:hypothetical protein [Portunus trituberculatus]